MYPVFDLGFNFVCLKYDVRDPLLIITEEGNRGVLIHFLLL